MAEIFLLVVDLHDSANTRTPHTRVAVRTSKKKVRSAGRFYITIDIIIYIATKPSGETQATKKEVNFLVRFPNWYFGSTTTNTKHQTPI